MMLDKSGAEKIFKRIENALKHAVEKDVNINDCMWYIHIQVQKLREIVLGEAGEKWVEISHQIHLVDPKGGG